MAKITEQSVGIMTNSPLNVRAKSLAELHIFQRNLLDGVVGSLISNALMLDSPKSEEIGTPSTKKKAKLKREIKQLQNCSMELRNQISVLENEESEIANKIATKMKQMQTLDLFIF